MKFIASVFYLILLAVPGLVMADVYVVNQVDLTFDPADLVINVGDTVEWHWSSGNHTVTNGTGNADPMAGDLFDAPLTAGDPMFSYTFTVAGDVDYFCRPHDSLGMHGVIRVHDNTATDDSNWSNVKALY